MLSKRMPKIDAVSFRDAAVTCLDTVVPHEGKLDIVWRPLRNKRYAERFKHLKQECFARWIVANAEFDVVKHGFPAARGPARAQPDLVCITEI
jgi:hypothetical protein